MKTFKKWDGKFIQDNITECSKEYKEFCTEFKNYLKRTFPEAEVIGFKANHYDTSGFLRFGERYIYISSSMNRYRGYYIFSENNAMNGVLYRTAKDPKDFRGGMNHFTSFNDLEKDIRKMLEAKGLWEVA